MALSPGARALGWAALAAAGWDVFCPEGETLSEVIARGIRDERSRYLVCAALAMMAAHLFSLARSA